MRFDATPTSLLLSLLLALAALPPAAVAARPKNAILLSEVRSLTLRAGHKTTSRRLPPIPQLRCLSGRALCDLAGVQTMRCTNQGSSYTSQDVEWACAASVPGAVRLDRTEVLCEGYESADDAYVLRGSCGVEYTLRLTEEGREKYPGLARGGWGGREGNGSDWGGYLFGVLFVAVLGWIVYSACVGADGNRTVAGNRRRRRGNGGGGWGGWGPGWGPGGGGGGGGGWDDPPPPYPGSGPGPKPSSTEQGWRPGFWSGLASGAAAGYMAGNRGQRNNDRYYGRGGGAWGDTDSGVGWGSGRSSSSGSAGSGARHESTGYGSTNRR